MNRVANTSEIVGLGTAWYCLLQPFPRLYSRGGGPARAVLSSEDILLSVDKLDPVTSLKNVGCLWLEPCLLFGFHPPPMGEHYGEWDGSRRCL